MSRIRTVQCLTLGALLCCTGAAYSQQRLNFISCPIVRDTLTVPCWLTEYDGELYYMGIQTDVSAEFHPPYLGHRVLVEGTANGDRPRICGGIVLEPIRISVMPELDASCNTILPAVPEYTIDFNPRPPGPSGGRLAFDPPPDAAPAPRPEPVATGPKTFELYFDVDLGIAFRHPRDILEIRAWAERIDARRITIRGFRGATLLSNGEVLTESHGIAARRAAEVAELLRGLEVPGEIRVESAEDPVTPDGIDDWRSRRVSVRIEP